MKKIIFTTISVIFLALFTSSAVFAQGMPAPSRAEGMGNSMMGGNNAITQGGDGLPAEASAQAGHTAREEAEGKVIWEKLQAKEISCDKLSEDDFERLGEYFMGQMLAPSGAEGAGSSHEVMNNMMVRMIGEEGEKQMHIAMGKRNNGCDTSAAFSQKGVGFIPMMGSGFGNMMGGWGGFGILGWIIMLVFWLLLILGVVALIRYLGGSRKTSGEDKSPLDILKERYARGKIDKKEFEEMKKDLR